MQAFPTLRARTAWAIVVALCLGGTQAAAQTVPAQLSLQDAIGIARENSPTYLTERNQLRSARWGVRSAYGSLLPSVNTSTGFGYTAGGERRFDSVVLDRQPAQLSSRYSLGFSLSLNGSTLLAPSVAKAQQRAAVANVDGAGASLESNVTQRYIAVLEARATVEQAQREVARTEEHVRLAQARLDVGSGTQLDVSRANVERGRAEVQLLQARNTERNNILSLGQVLGTSLPDSVELVDEFDLFEPAWTAEGLVDIALAENPTLTASRAQSDAASTRAHAAASAYLPTVSLSAGFSGYVSQASETAPLFAQELQRAQSVYSSCLKQNELLGAVGLPLGTCSDPTVPAYQQQLRDQIERQNQGFPFGFINQPASASISISLPIFNGLSRQQQVEEARIARLNAQYQVRAQELQVEVDVKTALRNLETAYSSALLQRQIRETAEEEMRLAEEQFRFGANTSVEVVDAQASLAEAERAEIAAVYEFHRSLAILESIIGQPLER